MLMYFWLWLGCSAYIFLAMTELLCLCILTAAVLQCLCIFWLWLGCSAYIFLAVAELLCLYIFGCG